MIAKQTILGYVQPPFGHVHITEIDGIHAVNPLQRGHLTPYRDQTKPVSATSSSATSRATCRRRSGSAAASSSPSTRSTRRRSRCRATFRGLPVAPALVQLDGDAARRHASSCRGRRPPTSGRRCRRTRSFCNVYAKGTYENAPRFGSEQYTSMPGRYLFLLAGNYDTTHDPERRLRARRARRPTCAATSRSARERFSVLNAHERRLPGLAARAAGDRAAADRAAGAGALSSSAASPSSTRVRAPVDVLQPLDACRRTRASRRTGCPRPRRASGRRSACPAL